jgi:hypothetical protein
MFLLPLTELNYGKREDRSEIRSENKKKRGQLCSGACSSKHLEAALYENRTQSDNPGCKRETYITVPLFQRRDESNSRSSFIGQGAFPILTSMKEVLTRMQPTKGG